jgi:U3 small nucleolar RNA-associated protein 19
MVASFLKRLARVIVGEGTLLSVNDTMFCVSLIANLIKRHPRCLRLVHRKQTALSLGKKLTQDPFLVDQADPLETRALKSSLWELEILMKKHYD